jgi:hypothetical protein
VILTEDALSVKIIRGKFNRDEQEGFPRKMLAEYKTGDVRKYTRNIEARSYL